MSEDDGVGKTGIGTATLDVGSTSEEIIGQELTLKIYPGMQYLHKYLVRIERELSGGNVIPLAEIKDGIVFSILNLAKEGWINIVDGMVEMTPKGSELVFILENVYSEFLATDWIGEFQLYC